MPFVLATDRDESFFRCCEWKREEENKTRCPRLKKNRGIEELKKCPTFSDPVSPCVPSWRKGGEKDEAVWS